MTGRVPIVATLAVCGTIASLLTLSASAAPPPEFAYRSLSLGANTTCALTVAGKAKCWGNGEGGALGDGTRRVYGSSVPVNVAGLGGGVTAISTGFYFSCALARGGAVKCWGIGTSGQLGNGTSGPSAGSSTPVDVVGLTSGARGVAAGLHGACAVTSAGGVKCWGGQFAGDSTSTPRPVDVVGLSSGATAVSAGLGWCAITGGGGVKCWGAPVLGNGSRPMAGGILPVDVSGLGAGVKAIAVGHTQICALTSAGGVKCWGQNVNGQVGTGTRTKEDVLTPVDVSGLTSGVTAIATGISHTCALAAGGVVKCWGVNRNGELGIGRYTDSSPRPVGVVGLGSGVRAIDVGDSHSCAIDRHGVTKCWGSNVFGKAGFALPTRVLKSATPRAVYRQGAAPATTKSATFARFLSPSRNLSCEMSDGPRGVSVYCQSLNRPQSVRMGRTGAYTVCRGVRCLGDPAAGTRPLPYRGRSTVGRFTCSSLMAGIRCTVTRTGRGFLIDKAGVTRVG